MSLKKIVERAADDINVDLQTSGRRVGFDIKDVEEDGTVEVTTIGGIEIDEIERLLKAKVPGGTSVAKAA